MSNPECNRRRISPSEIKEYLGELNPDAALLDGYEHALIGVATRFGQEPIALYDKEVILRTLEMDMTREEAIEFFEYNIIGGYVKHCPAFFESPLQSVEDTKTRKSKPKRKSNLKKKLTKEEPCHMIAPITYIET